MWNYDFKNLDMGAREDLLENETKTCHHFLVETSVPEGMI